MIVRRWATWVLEPDFAPVIRLMQDQPLIYANMGTLHSDTNFAHRIGDAVRQTYTITDGQREAIERIIAERNWVEPPRWRAFADVVNYDSGPVYRITACPGADDDADIRELARSRPEGMPGELTIGEINECTWDIFDPRPERRSASAARNRPTSPSAAGLVKMHALAASSSNRQTPN
jgi:hypothetical protein